MHRIPYVVSLNHLTMVNELVPFSSGRDCASLSFPYHVKSCSEVLISARLLGLIDYA